jgi:hypothetical protein
MHWRSGSSGRSPALQERSPVQTPVPPKRKEKKASILKISGMFFIRYEYRYALG